MSILFCVLCRVHHIGGGGVQQMFVAFFIKFHRSKHIYTHIYLFVCIKSPWLPDLKHSKTCGLALSYQFPLPCKNVSIHQGRPGSQVKFIPLISSTGQSHLCHILWDILKQQKESSSNPIPHQFCNLGNITLPTCVSVSSPVR